MLERLAEGYVTHLAEHTSGLSWSRYGPLRREQTLNAMRAAISALRNPDEGMLKAMTAAYIRSIYGRQFPIRENLEPSSAPMIAATVALQALIDHILNEAGTE